MEKEMKPVETPFYTFDQFLAIVGISRVWYYHLVRAGKINFRVYRRGRRVFFYKEDVDKYIKTLTRPFAETTRI